MLTLNKIASPDYREQLSQLAANGAFAAATGARYAPEVLWLAVRNKAKTVLDYGSGPGSLRVALVGCGLGVAEFDPGIRGLDAMPEPADIVVCTDVLEHVEPTRLPFVLRHLHELTKIAAFIVIATRPADKRLPDGRNAHLIIDNPRWWYERLCDLDWEVHVHHYALTNTDNAYFILKKR